MTTLANEQDRDTSGQEQLLAAFARWSRTYERILHAAGEGIFSLDLGGCISFANTAAARLLGVPPEDLQGHPLESFLAGPETEEPLFLPANRQEYQHHRLHFSTGEGLERVVELSQALIWEDDQCLGAVVMFNDLTEQEKASRALAESRAHLEVVNGRLSRTHDQLVQAEKLAAVGQLAAGVAHEINTPMGYIRSNLGTLTKHVGALLELIAAYEKWSQPASGEAVAALENARRQTDLAFVREDAPQLLGETSQGVQRVARVVRHLLDFANAYSNGAWETRGVDALLHTAVGLCPRAQWQELTWDLGQELPPLACLPDRLAQALANIVDNACQATGPQGRVVVRAFQPDGEHLALEVEDDGCGIPPENLDRIYNPFFTTRPVGGGEGMGLSIADAVVRLHGGKLLVESAPGRGTRVRITLPLSGRTALPPTPPATTFH